MHGRGLFIWASGQSYEGEYKNNKRNGFGQYSDTDGRIYFGEWRQGRRDGIGYIIQSNYEVRKTKFEIGKRIEYLPITEEEKAKVLA